MAKTTVDVSPTREHPRRRAMTDSTSRIHIDLGAMRHNVSAIASLIGPTCELIAVVKADGYGHGMIASARAALAGGARRLAVTTVHEGVTLRQAGLGAPVIVMGIFGAADATAMLAHQLTPVVIDRGQLAVLAEAVRKSNMPASPLSIHLKVDTGMGRLGLPADECLDALAHASAVAELSVEGLMTHFADADTQGSSYTAEQCRQFAALLDWANRGRPPAQRPLLGHAANSAALLTNPESRFQMVRSGLALYGVLPAPHCRDVVPLRPVMSWISHIAHIRNVPAGRSLGYGRTFTTTRPSRIGLISVGYATGYARALSNQAYCLHRGVRRPIVGRVSMDLTMIDLTDQAEAAVGDEVVLLGRQGDASVTAEELAAWAHTIPYEILCSAGNQHPREYHDTAE